MSKHSKSVAQFVAYVLSPLGAMALAPSATAQETATPAGDTPALEEIVVTARRTEERLQDTPLAVTALSAEALAERSIADLSGVANFAPNITFKGGGNAAGGSNTQVFIRGVGQDDFLPTADPGVGIYVDGVYLGRSVGGLLKAADIEQVEVLRGPQGTLFGRNTIGGAINVTTITPSRTDVTGAAQVVAGDDSLAAINGHVSGPFSDTVAGLVSVAFRQRDGYGRSTAAPNIDFGDEDWYQLRGKLLFAPSENLELVLAADYYKQDQTNQPVSAYGVRCGDGTFGACPNSSGTPFPNLSPTGLPSLYNNFIGIPTNRPFTNAQLAILDNPYVGTATGPAEDDAEVYGASITVDWTISDRVNFKSITAYRELDARFSGDNDGASVVIAFTDDQFTQDQFSQEFQLGFNTERVRGILGAYFFQEEARDVNSAIITPGLYNALEGLPVNLPTDPMAAPVPCALQTFTPIPGTPFRAPPPGFGLGCSRNIANTGLDNEFLVDGTIRVDNFAVFGQATWALGDRWSLTTGLRYTYEKKEIEYFQQRLAISAALGVPFFAVVPTTADETWDNVSPRVGVEFQPNDDQLLYASYAQGFKSGTFNGRATNTQGVAPVDPETVDQIELGWKSEFANRRVRLNAALFYSDYQDIQLQSVVQDPQQGLLINLINAGSGEVYGAELEIAARPTAALDLGFTAGYTNSEISDVDPRDAASTGVSNGNTLKKSPEFNFSASAQYTVPLPRGSLKLRADYSWVDEQFHDAANSRAFDAARTPITLEDSYGLLNARVAYLTAGEALEIAAYGNNLSDEVYFNSLFLTGGGNGNAYPARGRDYGLSLRYRF
jgi:iron complex outermembrane receptor protein